MTSILIGCDPEVFVRKDGVFKSAFGLIQGDKKNPQKVNKGAVQVDGMALEFNTDPAASEDEFCLNVQTVYETMRRMVPGYEVVAVPVAHFDPAHLAIQPEAALELGCDPDYNGWTGMCNDKPDGNRPMRTASGHVHIGFGSKNRDIQDPRNMHEAAAVARQMDFYLGLASLEYDNDVLRREMYGKAGCFRPKPYGVEYRTLSNAWLNSPKLIKWVFRNAVKGTQALFDGKDLANKYGDIQAIINESNVAEARKILKAEKIEVCRG